MADQTVPLGTEVEPEVDERLRLTRAIRRAKVWQLVNAALDSYLPSLDELRASLGPKESEATT